MLIRPLQRLATYPGQRRCCSFKKRFEDFGSSHEQRNRMTQMAAFKILRINPQTNDTSYTTLINSIKVNEWNSTDCDSYWKQEGFSHKNYSLTNYQKAAVHMAANYIDSSEEIIDVLNIGPGKTFEAAEVRYLIKNPDLMRATILEINPSHATKALLVSEALNPDKPDTVYSGNCVGPLPPKDLQATRRLIFASAVLTILPINDITVFLNEVYHSCNEVSDGAAILTYSIIDRDLKALNFSSKEWKLVELPDDLGVSLVAVIDIPQEDGTITPAGTVGQNCIYEDREEALFSKSRLKIVQASTTQDKAFTRRIVRVEPIKARAEIE